MKNQSTRRGFTQNIVICPPCGESVAVATKEGQNWKNTLWSLLPRLTAVLPPQGREITAQGFTLIELLVVVLIIGILAAVAVPQYQKAVEKSRASEAITFVKSLADAEKIFYLANGEYTNKFSNLDIGLDLDDSIYATKDWSFSLKNTDKTVPRISSIRTAYEEKKGQYYIGYDLTINKLYCATSKNDTKGSSFCSPFGVPTACNHSAGDPCVYF